MLWPMQVSLSSSLHALLLSQARATHPLECCGLLFGDNDRVLRIEPAANVSPDPERAFEIDPVRLIAAERAMRHGGERVVGYYHSHPNGRAEPSPCDARASAGDGRLWLIVAGDALTGWRANPGGRMLGAFDSVAIEVTG